MPDMYPQVYKSKGSKARPKAQKRRKVAESITIYGQRFDFDKKGALIPKKR